MPYQYALERPDYTDLAAGQVFYSAPGYPAFPVRLASEIFLRCQVVRRPGSEPVVLYDPCCGAGYLLSVLACLHGENIRALAASDIDARAVELARLNLGLLQPGGLRARQAQLERDLAAYGKESHREALASAARLSGRVDELARLGLPPAQVFAASALDGPALAAGLAGLHPDLVICDVPYGQHSAWRTPGGPAPAEPLPAMLAALSGVLAPGGVVAIASDKGQKAAHPHYRRVDRFQLGKRRVEFFQIN